MKFNTITAPRGFLSAGVACGIKKSGNSDLGLIVFPTGAKAAAVFTTNKVVSAAVEVCKRHVKNAEIQAVVVNSGCANTCTGQRGIDNAIKMCAAAAEQIEAEPGDVLLAPPGIIGVQLAMKK